MMNGICDSCAGLRRTSEPKSHHCAGMGCQCGSCNQVVVAYNSGALAYLQRISSTKNLLTIGGFGLLQLATLLYSAFGAWAPLVSIGLVAENGFFLVRAWEEYKSGR